MHGVYARSSVFPLFLTSVAICKGCQGNDQTHLKTSLQERTAYLFFSLLASNIFKIHNTFSLMKSYFTENQTSQYGKELSLVLAALPWKTGFVQKLHVDIYICHRFFFPWKKMWGVVVFHKIILVKSVERSSLPQRRAWEKLGSVQKGNISCSLQSTLFF